MAQGVVTKQIWTELSRIKNFTEERNLSNGKFFYKDSLLYGGDEESPSRNVIAGSLWPTANIYKDHALRIEIQLPATYPMDPPEVKIEPPIYHPNVDESGRLSADSLVKAGSWKNTTTLLQVLEIIVDAIDNPSIDKPLNAEAAKDYDKSRPEYERKALEKIKKTGFPRS